jgi:hypothetical protein
LRRWVIVSLGGSDIQYKSDRDKKPEERRLKNYSEDCEVLYHYLQKTGDFGDLDVPLIQALVGHLLERSLPPDIMVVYYTQQDSNQAERAPGHAKDTYWAYRVIQYLAQETDFFGIRCTVEGIHVRGNPADYEQMVYLYKDEMTSGNLKRLGVRDEDEIYACFTAGTPAMSIYLLMGYSTLHYPRKRECFAVHLARNGSVIHQLPAVELLRHDDTFRLIKKLLESRQFNEAGHLMSSVSFSFLRGCNQEAQDWIQLLHERYLFCFDRALQILRRCQSAFTGEPFLDRMKRELEMFERGMEKYQRLDADTASAVELKVLMSEYLHKVLFFWDSEQWNEFAYVSGSFYEWVIQVAFFDAIGYSLASRNVDKKKWGQFLKKQGNLPDWLKPVVENHDDKESDRHFCSRVLRSHDKWAKFANSAWFIRMERFYAEIRNIRVHQLRGTKREEVMDYLGTDWHQKTKAILAEYFGLEGGNSKFQKAIDDFIDFLNKKFVEKYGFSTISE